MTSKFKKSLLITTIIIVSFVILIIVFISPITKYMIEKYDEQYTGRKITLDLAYVNPFTGYIYLRNLSMFESNSDSVFFSAKGIGVNVSLMKLFSKTYEITSLTLTEPKSYVIQSREQFNFTDLLEKFAGETDTLIEKEAVHYIIKDIEIKDGEFHYIENTIPVNYFIKNTNLSCDGVWWDRDTINGEFSFESGIGTGKVEGDFTVNVKDSRYRTATKITKFDMELLEQYMKDLSNYGTLSATLDADIKAEGSYEKTEDITVSGLMVVNDFHFGKTPSIDYASFDKLTVAITEVSPTKYIFQGDSIILDHLKFVYEQYDYLDNLQTMFGEGGKNIDAAKADSSQFNLIIEIAEYIKSLSQYFFKSQYKINKFAVNQADIRYNDYSLSEKFSMDLNPLNIIADSVDKKRDWVHLKVHSGIKPYGLFAAGVTINPKDSSDFDMEYNLDKVPLSMFNPYMISYASYPFDRGMVDFKGRWHVRNGNIESVNHLVVIDPRITKRLRNKEDHFIPMRPVMALVREQGNVIDYEIPVTGELENPNFHISDIITDVLKNIFVKPVKTGYRIKVKNVETDIEKSLTLKWPMRRATLLPPQEHFIEKMVEFLSKNPEASIRIYPEIYSVKEKEYILFFEAKKKYFLEMENKKTLNEDDSTHVDKMSVKDKDFVKYLHKHFKDSLKFTIQEKCAQVVSQDELNRELNQLMEFRKTVFMEAFKKANLEKQISFQKETDVIPFNGFSFYKIEYKGEFPSFLMKAYNDMQQLNEEPPRKKFKKDREKQSPVPEVNPNASK